MLKTPTHITDYLKRNAELYVNEPAFICPERTLTWVELYAESDALGQQLLARIADNSSQQVIGLLMANSWQFVVAYLGILQAGHIVMPIDPNLKKLEVTALIEQTPPVLTLTSPAFVDEIPDNSEILMQADFLTSAPNDRIEPLRMPAQDQIVSLLFTSGTTGKPKVTAYTHKNYLWNIDAVTELWQWTKQDTLLLSLPLSHWHGLAMGVCGAIKNANTVYLHERFDAEETLKTLASGNVSLFMHVPIAYFKLVEFEEYAKYDISNVRLCVSGSSYLPPKIWHGFKEKYGHEILERYGASEMGLIASNRLDDREPGSVGFVLPGVDVRVEADGQLAMRSPGLFPGYFNNSEATKKQFTHDGWWLTGDIGVFAENGRIKLVGRIQEKIKKLGYTIYPRDVEWALMKNHDIHEVVVVGVQIPDSLSDDMVYFVVGNLTEQQIRDYCKQNLPSFWRPDIVVFLDEIPKSRAGKPKIQALRELIA